MEKSNNLNFTIWNNETCMMIYVGSYQKKINVLKVLNCTVELCWYVCTCGCTCGVIKKLIFIQMVSLFLNWSQSFLFWKLNLFAFLKRIKLNKQSLFCESMLLHTKTSPFAWCLEIAAITASVSWSLLILCM